MKDVEPIFQVCADYGSTADTATTRLKTSRQHPVKKTAQAKQKRK
jgi:hypothetical protein